MIEIKQLTVNVIIVKKIGFVAVLESIESTQIQTKINLFILNSWEK